MSSAEAVLNENKAPTSLTGNVFRVDIFPKNPDFAEKMDHPLLGEMIAYPVYWICSATLTQADIETLAKTLLADPFLQDYHVSSRETGIQGCNLQHSLGVQWILERQFLPGVTDNLGKTVENNVRLILECSEKPDARVASGHVFWLTQSGLSRETIEKTIKHQLYNPLVEQITLFEVTQSTPVSNHYAFPMVYGDAQKPVAVIALDIDEAALIQISQQRNLALTLEEMQVIQRYYQRADIQQHRQQQGLPIWPTDIELEILAQTWSEHCKHKIFAAKITYTDWSDPDYPVTTEIDSLFKTFIAGSTNKLAEKRPDLLSVFKDNAGVLQWDESSAICFKVETHNSPSALEPYGGALTGIVGVNRDILGTGMGAKPLFNTDVFCFAHPEDPYVERPKMLPPDAILRGVRKGVEDGGNKSGIPTINGSLFFSPQYRAKPLVFCGTGGLLPLKLPDKLGYEKYTQAGDIIVMAGGRVGKDGIHGATFSSEALHQDSPVSAVQIGDPITQKRMTDFLMEARDMNLLTGITDNGAGGLSSSVGEMAEITNGATLQLEKIPLKYLGLAPYEIVISESQERMTMSTRDMPALSKLAEKHDVEISAIGEFHDRGTFEIVQNGKCLASLDLAFLHHGLPQMQLEAVWSRGRNTSIRAEDPPNPDKILLELLAHPNVCSREALIRQYDHEVQGRSVIKPLMGHKQTAPCDAAVIQPILGKPEGLVVSNGLCPQYSDWDTYQMAACAVDEAVRNAVAVGANPKSIALLDNFCWPDPLPSARNPDAELKLAQLVRACKALSDITLTYETPLISGKDSMKNDFDDGEYRLSIPPTLLISAIGKIPDITQAISMEFKVANDPILLLGQTNIHLGGSLYYDIMGWYSPFAPHVIMSRAKKIYAALYECIQKGWIRSCHDLSEGGLGVALGECVLGGNRGAKVSLENVILDSPELRWDEALFSESPSRFVVSVPPAHLSKVELAFEGLPCLYLGHVTDTPELHIELEPKTQTTLNLSTADMLQAWRRAPAQCYETGMTP